MLRRRRFRRQRQEAELNITAFMNLMVVLVPFLLLMAVFTRLTVIELALPGSTIDIEAPEEPPIELEVVLRADRVDIQDRGSALIAQYPRLGERDDTGAIVQKLRQIKAQFPEVTTASILAEDDVPYDRIVQIMEIMRSYNTMAEDALLQETLFPEISLGKATLETLPPEARQVDQP